VIPKDITQLIKIWHSNNEIPKLNLKALATSTSVYFECALDKNHWGILNIHKYTFKYETYFNNNKKIIRYEHTIKKALTFLPRKYLNLVPKISTRGR